MLRVLPVAVFLACATPDARVDAAIAAAEQEHACRRWIEEKHNVPRGCEPVAAQIAEDERVAQESRDADPPQPVRGVFIEVPCTLAAHRAALQMLVSRGFDVTMSDSGAGVLAAEATRGDPEGTDYMERKRRNLFNELSSRAQRDEIMARGPLTRPQRVQRTIKINVAIRSDAATITPVITVCVLPSYGCGAAREMLPNEVEDLKAVEAAIRAASPAEREAPVSPTSTEL